MYRRIMLLIVSLFLLASCTTPTAPPATQASAEPQASNAVSTDVVSQEALASIPSYAKTNATGRVVSPGGEPLAETTVRLAEVYRPEGGVEGEGAFALDEAQSPGAITDAQGNFTFQNIDAREYVLVVGDPNGLNAIVAGEDGRPRIWSPSADQTLEMGEIPVNLQAAPSPSS